MATGPSGQLANNNYGGGGALAVAAPGLPNGEFQTVLKFDLSSARAAFDMEFGASGWSLQSVTLQLSSSPHSNAIYNNVAAGSFGVSLLQNNSWVEGSGNASNPGGTGITYNSLLNTFENNASDSSLGTFNFPGGTSGENSYVLDMASDLRSSALSGGTVSLRLFAADSSVSYLFTSRSATPASVEPQLVLVAVPEPGTVALVVLGGGLLLVASRKRSL